MPMHTEEPSILQRLEQLEKRFVATDTKSSPIREDLPERQRAVLQAILELPENAFKEAEGLIGTLQGQPMSEYFADSFKGILRAKGWGVTCESCSKPSVILWRADKRYTNGGYAQFSHSGPSSHGSMITIRNVNLVKKLDLRKKTRR